MLTFIIKMLTTNGLSKKCRSEMSTFLVQMLTFLVKMTVKNLLFFQKTLTTDDDRWYIFAVNNDAMLEEFHNGVDNLGLIITPYLGHACLLHSSTE